MPLECPVFTQDFNYTFSGYNACLDCRYKHEDECWYHIKDPRKLSDILTTKERLAILEYKIETLEPQEIIHRHISYKSDVSKEQWYRIDSIISDLKDLRKKFWKYLETEKNKYKDRL